MVLLGLQRLLTLTLQGERLFIVPFLVPPLPVPPLSSVLALFDVRTQYRKTSLAQLVYISHIRRQFPCRKFF